MTKETAREYTSSVGKQFGVEWNDGRRHGKGTGKLSNGNILVGEWEEGVKNGEFTLKLASSSRSTSEENAYQTSDVS
jgi:hypothetical protein